MNDWIFFRNSLRGVIAKKNLAGFKLLYLKN